MLSILTMGFNVFANDAEEISSAYKPTATLKGGIKLELAMNTHEFIPLYLNRYKLQIDQLLQTHNDIYYIVEPTEQLHTIKLLFKDKKSLEASQKLIAKQFAQFTQQITENEDKQPILNLILSNEAIKDISTKAIAEVKQVLVNRVNELAIAGAKVQEKGENRLEIGLPGVQDSASAIQTLTKKVRLEFRLQAKEGSPTNSQDEFEFDGRTILLENSAVITEQHISDIALNNTYTPMINIKLDEQGGELMSQVSRNNIGSSMAVVLIKQIPKVSYIKATKDKQTIQLSSIEDKQILILAVIRDKLSNSIVISSSPKEGRQLITLLEADKLLAAMHFASEASLE